MGNVPHSSAIILFSLYYLTIDSFYMKKELLENTGIVSFEHLKNAFSFGAKTNGGIIQITG